MPPASYRRPEAFDPSNLSVHVVGEDGVDLGVYRFDQLVGPRELLAALVAGFARAAGPGGRWSSRRTLQENAKRLQVFFRDIQAYCPGIESIGELTPQAWAAWREHMHSVHRWPGTINSVRVILHLSPGLPAPMQAALRARHRKPKTRSVLSAYSRDDFMSIQRAAWQVVDSAAYRIRRHVQELARYRQAKEEVRRLDRHSEQRGELLEGLARTGYLAKNSAGQVPYRNIERLVPERSSFSATQVLFLTHDEVFAFMVLLAAIRGYNPDTIDALTIADQRPDGGVDETAILNVSLQKPRAAQGSQQTNDNLLRLSARSAGALMQLATELTQPARIALRSRGQPTNCLLICRLRRPNDRSNPFCLSINRPNATKEWLKKSIVTAKDGNPIRVTLQRIRHTEQTLNRRPRMNSLDTHESIYVMREPSVVSASEEVIVAGQREALDHAHASAKMRGLSQEQYARAQTDPVSVAHELSMEPAQVRDLAAGRLNTPLAACIDFEYSPFSGGGQCRASFLLCLACQNAVATPNHLPRFVCLHDAFTKMASAVAPAVWQADFAAHYQRLTHLLNVGATPAEIAVARKAVRPADELAIEALLQRRLDA